MISSSFRSVGSLFSCLPRHTSSLAYVQSTSRVGGTTRPSRRSTSRDTNFNPRPPCGGRPYARPITSAGSLFQSTSPVRGTTFTASDFIIDFFISIHVPRAGDDACWQTPSTITTYFNPRPPCGGRRDGMRSGVVIFNISIHVPRAGDDASTNSSKCTTRNFNPRPPCGGRLGRDEAKRCKGNISIHVPRAGDDTCTPRETLRFSTFQSTSPVRGTTVAVLRRWQGGRISIHVPRAGDDSKNCQIF